MRPLCCVLHCVLTCFPVEAEDCCLQLNIRLLLLCVCSMLLNDPKQRCTAETALLSPFFSIPFGMCQYLRLTLRSIKLSVHHIYLRVFVCVCVCVSASHWRPGPAALSRPASAQPDRWQSSAQWWRVWRYGSMLFILCDSERNDLISYFLWVCRVWSNLSLFSARHTGGHEGRVPEVRLSGFSAHSKGEPRERTGETVDLWTRKLLIVSIKVGTRGDTGE